MKKEHFSLVITAHFDAAHSIRFPGSICEKLHGHRWTLAATFSGPLREDGVVRDFLELERELRERVISKLDHSNLNDLFESPTSEIICRWIWDRLAPLRPSELRLWETPEFSVIYRREEPGA